jgi:O-antigen ligase
LAGYGGKDPGWGEAIGKSVTDLNNEFLLAGVQYGILGLIALCVVLVAAFRGLVRAFRETTDEELHSLYWAMGSVLVGVIAIWQGVGFFGQMTTLFYSILGVIGASFSLREYGRA